jgi:hypothetical protein
VEGATGTEAGVNTKPTSGPWHLRTANGRLPIVREIKRPHGEASHYEAAIGSGDILSGPIVVKLDFGYGTKSDEANARQLAKASEMRTLLEEIADFGVPRFNGRIRELLADITGGDA